MTVSVTHRCRIIHMSENAKKGLIMNACADRTALRREIAAIAVWENEGGAPGRNFTRHQYGRRIEPDSSWSVYHVFTGVPADIEGGTMTGLSRSEATLGMMALNRHDEGRGLRERGSSTLEEVLS
jgi:hypothetical protein